MGVPGDSAGGDALADGADAEDQVETEPRCQEGEDAAIAQ